MTPQLQQAIKLLQLGNLELSIGHPAGVGAKPVSGGARKRPATRPERARMRIGTGRRVW